MKGSDAIIGILIVMFISFLGGVYLTSVILNTSNQVSPVVTSNEPTIVPTENNTIDNLTEEENNDPSPISIREKYDELVNIPYVADLGPTKSPEELYSTNQGDCSDKSIAFADWLYNQGYTDISIVVIDGPSKSSKHCFVLFQNRIYDLSPPTKYNWTKQSTKEYFEDMGYTSWEENSYYSGMWRT